MWAAIQLEEKFRVAPLKDKLDASEKKRIETELRLAPFLAASDRYLSNVPSAERLATLLNYITNSAADVKALRDFQSRSAKLVLTAIGEGAGWSNETVALFPQAIVYIPLL